MFVLPNPARLARPICPDADSNLSSFCWRSYRHRRGGDPSRSPDSRCLDGWLRTGPLDRRGTRPGQLEGRFHVPGEGFNFSFIGSVVMVSALEKGDDVLLNPVDQPVFGIDSP